MSLSAETRFNRRKLMAGAAALAGVFKMSQGTACAQAASPASFNRNSAPSQLKITDMRFVLVASNYDYPIIRIDTNQGVYGLGEVRDAGREGTALVLKPHLIGKNPLYIEPILDGVRNFANHQRMGGGYSALDMALHDIAGKVYGVPAWRLIGSKYRDRIRIYCDTTESRDPKIYAERFKARKAQGFTFFKMDLEEMATIEVTSEASGFPVESVFVPGSNNGWRATVAGEQTLRAATAPNIWLRTSERQLPRVGTPTTVAKRQSGFTSTGGVVRWAH